jgi:hypothetical protein
MKFSKILEQKKLKMNVNIRKKINKELTKLTFNKYFKAIPLKDIETILKNNNIVLLQEDNTKFAGFLTGNNATADFELSDIGSTMGGTVYVPYDNVKLILSWYKMPSGNYEINAYIS